MDDFITLEEAEKKTGIHILIDYFSSTFPLICHVDEHELLIVEDTINMLAWFLNYKKDEIEKQTYGQNRFKYQYKFGDNIIVRLAGPVLKNGYKSCMIEMKGEGCREWEVRNLNKSWIEFVEFFVIRLNGSPTRLDLTIDDYSGDYICFEYLKNNLDKKNFTTNFLSKKYNLYGNDEDGWTIQMGNRTSTQELVIYEKDKERKKKNKDCIQDYWLRLEMRFRHNKAYDVAMNIANLNNQDDFKRFAMERLYEMIDIKRVGMNYSSSNFNKTPTDQNWLNFLDNVKKAKLKRYKIHKSTYESYLEFTEPKVASYITHKLLQFHGDSYLTITYLLELALKDFDKFDDKRLKRYNDYLENFNINPVSMDDVEELRHILEVEIEKRSGLPF